MNKFNLGLHGALFYYSERETGLDNPDIKNDGLTQDEREDLELDENAAGAVIDFDGAEADTKTDLMEFDDMKIQYLLDHWDSNFDAFGNAHVAIAMKEIYDRRNNGSLDRSKVAKIRDRMKENLVEPNKGRWEKNIREGYKFLLKTLQEHEYFKGPYHKNESEIRDMYAKQVRLQCEKYIWEADDQQFNARKWELFSSKMEDDYPAKIVYGELNHAADIFARDVSVREAYAVDTQNKGNYQSNLQDVNSWKQKDKRKFLSSSLPNYLWGTKDTTTLEKILGRTPIFRIDIDKVSDKDKAGIVKFINLVERIKLDEENTGKPELLLLEIFKDAKSNRTRVEWENALKGKGLSINTTHQNSFFSELNKAYQFYAESQSAKSSAENQHNLYLSVLGIIESKGGFDGAIASFKDDVDAYNTKKTEVESGELKQEDPELYNVAYTMNQNYESALNLSRMNAESFANRDMVDIIADFDNDGVVLYRDLGVTKTGLQFRDMVKRIGETEALNNLLKHAKLLNTAMGLGLKDEDVDLRQIKSGNKKLILLLQSIVSEPGEELYTLLTSGTNANEKYVDNLRAIESAPKGPDDPLVQEAAKKLLESYGDVKLEDFQSIEGFENVATREGLHQAVAGALYTEYTRGLGLGWTVPFDKWVDGLAINGGFQGGDTGLSLGLTLSYKKEIDLGKGWTRTGQGSIGYIPFVSFSGEFSQWGEASVGGELAKKWIDNHQIAQKVGLNLSYTRVFGTANVYSAMLGRSRDRVEGIEGSVESKEKEFKDGIVSPLIKKIGESLGEKELNLGDKGDKDSREKIEKIINEKVDESLNEDEKSKLGEDTRKRLINNTIRYLCNFNGLKLSDEIVRELIVNDMSKRYALEREHAEKDKIRGEEYLSGGRIGFSWVQLGAYGTGIIHAGLSWTEHTRDVYGDRSVKKHRVSPEKRITKAEEKVDEINKKLNREELKIDGEYIVIPNSLLRKVYIDPQMKKLIKKKDGDVLIHKDTQLSLPTIMEGVATASERLNVGGTNASIQLITIMDDPEWFTEGEVDADKLPGIDGDFSMDLLEEALDSLRKQAPELKDFHFDESILAKLEKGHKYKIMLKKEGGNIQVENPVEVTSGKPLKLEYESFQEQPMMSKEARSIAQNIYGEIGKIITNALYNISHSYKYKEKDSSGTFVDKTHRARSSYQKFADAMVNGKYDVAKTEILAMLPKMQDYINKSNAQKEKVDFSKVVEELNKLKGAELGKALMSINNIFARVSSVKGGNGENIYRFEGNEGARSMNKVIEMRAKEIKSKISHSGLDSDIQAAYNSLIDYAEKYRADHSQDYEASSAKAAPLKNAIGINLGNSNSIENPLFNPEIYESSLLDLTNFDKKDDLMKRGLTVIANNKVLMDPILKELHLEGKDVKVEGFENNKLTLDIGGEKVKLSAEMEFAYFAQCVNHMLILEKIKAEMGGNKGSIELGNSVLGDGTAYEATAREVMGKRRFSVDVAFKIPQQQQEPKEPEIKPHSDNGNDGLNGPGNPDTGPGQDGNIPGETPENPDKPTNPGTTPPTGTNPGSGLD